MGILSKLLGLFDGSGMTSLTKKIDVPTFQEQFETFEELGFTLNEKITISEVIAREGGESPFVNRPYSLLYIALGWRLEQEPWTPFTNQCWTFDVEAIEDEGSYVGIMENIARVTNGDLVFESLESDFNLDEEIAWVSFTFKGDHYKWDLKVDDDWADENLFGKVQALAEKYQTKGRFTYFHTDGQCFVLGYHTQEELESIKQKTELDMIWLKAYK